MSLLEITDQEFDQELSNSDRPVLVYFWAAWCGPCRLMAPAVKALAEEYGDRLKVLKLEITPGSKPVVEYAVEGVPALRLFENKKLVLSQEGAMTKLKLSELIKDYLKDD
ncbi:MAG: thioredoxin family protein [Microcystaceae cyanobacterium]